MSEPLRVRSLAVSTLLLFAASAVPQGTAGATGNRHRPLVAPHLVPFPFLKKSVAFVPLIPNKTDFIEMGAFVADLTPVVLPGLKRPTAAIQLDYGYKKGGIACVYEMPLQPGLDALATYQSLIKGRVFRERQYFKDWTIKAVPDSKLLLAVSGTSPEVLGAMLRALGKR